MLCITHMLKEQTQHFLWGPKLGSSEWCCLPSLIQFSGTDRLQCGSEAQGKPREKSATEYLSACFPQV